MKFGHAYYRILPFAIYTGFFAVDGAFELLKKQGLPPPENWDMRWLYPAKILLVMLSLIWLRRNFTELGQPASVKAIDWLTGVTVGVIVFILWINLNQPWATMGHPAGYNPIDPLTHQPDDMLIFIRIFGAAIVVPLMEELFWRSFIMRWISRQDFLAVDPSQVGALAFILTTVLFASEHNLLLAGAIAGAAYGWLYMKTRNLWVPITAHAITNGLLGLWVINTQNWQFW